MSSSFHTEEEFEAITYKPLHDVTYQKLVTALRNGQFEPGTVLRTRTIAKALGVSSTPVREALRQLIAQNALDLDPKNRAAVVPTYTKELLDEMYSIRHVLDDLAVEAAATNITQEEIEKLRRLEKELEVTDAVPGSPEYSAFLDKSEEFFFTIFEASRRPILYQLLDDLWLRSSVILGQIRRKQPADFSIAKGRAALVKALEKRNVPAARKAMRDILTQTRNMVFKIIDAE